MVLKPQIFSPANLSPSTVVALTGLPVGYNIGLPIGYGVTIALNGLPIGYSYILILTFHRLVVGYPTG